MNAPQMAVGGNTDSGASGSCGSYMGIPTFHQAASNIYQTGQQAIATGEYFVAQAKAAPQSPPDIWFPTPEGGVMPMPSNPGYDLLVVGVGTFGMGMEFVGGLLEGFGELMGGTSGCPT